MSLFNDITASAKRAWVWLFSRQHKLTKHEIIMATLANLASDLAQINAQLTKAKAEIIAKVESLEAALTEVQLPVEAQDQLDALKSAAQSLDDLNTDPAPEA